jgi:hypothetical protein
MGDARTQGDRSCIGIMWLESGLDREITSMTEILNPIEIHPPESERDRTELSKLLEYLDRSPSKVNQRLQLIVRAILAGDSISVVSHHSNTSGEREIPQPDNIRVQSLRTIIAMTEEEGGYEDDQIRSIMASIDE